MLIDAPFLVIVHRAIAFSAGDSMGQAHFSAVMFRTRHANTRRKMSQTTAL